MSCTDEQYVELCLDGQPEVFRHLVLRYQDRLRSYLTGRLGDEHAATEAGQETFVRAYFALSKLKKPDSFYPWLLGIAGRVSKETYRQRKRQGQMLSLNDEIVESPTTSDPPTPDLREAIGQLPEVYRQMILLRYYGGLSCQKISSQQKIPLGTVTKRLSRAYALMRESLRRRQENDIEVKS